MKIFQHAKLSDDPIDPMDAVTKQYVDSRISSGVVNGGLFFIDVTPTSTGIVGTKQYVPNTVPANKVITEATADTNNVRVTLIAEGGGLFYSPTVTISTNPILAGTPLVVSLSEDASDKRFFTGFFDLIGVTEDVTVIANSNTNAEATLIIHRAVAGPNVNLVLIGALPGSQTEAKAGDIVQVSGRVPNDATYVEIISAGASGSVTSQTVGGPDSYGSGFRSFNGTFTASNSSGAQKVTARARNALGTYGQNLDSTNSITLNQTYPSISSRTIAYPAGQSALKGSETATVNATITNYDSVIYSTPGDLQVTNPNTYAVSKTVTRLSGAYVVNSNNYTITATKTSNNAQTTATAAVSIANSAATATIAIAGSPARLQSTGAGQDYIVRITPNQTLNQAPTLVASSGTWQGTWALAGGVWSRTLRIKDTDPKGDQTFNSLVLINLANVVGNQITSGSSYKVGGFATRTITFAAFTRYAAIGTNIVDFNKVTASYTGGAALTRQTNTDDVFQGFTIVNSDGTYNPNGDYLYISDAAFAGSNTTGTLQLDVSEAV